MKRTIDKSTIMVGDLKIPPSGTERTSRQKISTENEDLHNTFN